MRDLFGSVYVTETKGIGTESFGYFQTVYRIGNILMLVFIPYFYKKWGIKFILTVPFVVGYTVYLLVFYLNLGWVYFLGATFLLVIMTQLVHTSTFIYLQLNVPKAVHGKFFGIFELIRKSGALVGLLFLGVAFEVLLLKTMIHLLFGFVGLIFVVILIVFKKRE